MSRRLNVGLVLDENEVHIVLGDFLDTLFIQNETVQNSASQSHNVGKKQNCQYCVLILERAKLQNDLWFFE